MRALTEEQIQARDDARAAWGEWVRDRRAELGLSIRGMAKELGHKHHTKVQSWVEGRCIPRNKAAAEAQIKALVARKKSA